MSWLRKLKGSPNWYLCWREKGKMRRRSTGTSDRRLAERILREASAELVRRRFGLVEPAPGPDLRELCGRFLSWSRTVHRPKTTETYGWAFGHLLSWALDGAAIARTADSITTESFGSFIIVKRAEGLGDASLGILARHLRAFWNWCMARGWCAGNPVRVPRGAAQARTGYLTLLECARLIESERAPRWRELWRFLLLTGARVGETCALCWTDVDMRAGVILLRPETTKSGRMHRIEITADLAELLDRLRGLGAGDGRLWPYSRSWVSHRFKCQARRVELPEWVTAHTLRHTVASWLVMGGVSLKIVADILGHSSSRVTEEHYAHLAPGVRGREMQKSELTIALREVAVGGQD